MLAAATSAMLASGAGTSWKGRSAGFLCFQNRVSFEGFRTTLRFPDVRAASLSHEESGASRQQGQEET